MITVNHKICDECGTCISVCPANAISLEKTLRVSANKCALCNRCVTVCPTAALSAGVSPK